MDFGVDRLVDMIEDRFGRRTSNILLTLVVVAVAGYCVNLIYKFIISPVTWALLSGLKHASNGDIAVSKWQIINWLISICVGTALLTIYWFVASFVANRLNRRGKAIVAEAKAYQDQLRRQFDELLDLQSSVIDKHKRIDEFLNSIEPILVQHGIDVGPIKEKLRVEKSANS